MCGLSYLSAIAATTAARDHRSTLEPALQGVQVVKRTQRSGPAKQPARKQEPKPAWPVERHSGEGSASALETLQKLEKRRVASKPRDPHGDSDS